jgi:DNA-binding PadR family transcriptional regulator
MKKASDLLQGTLDLLILRMLDLRPLHGVGVAERIEVVTHGVFVVGPGSLCPALHRLADNGWIEGKRQLEKWPARQILRSDSFRTGSIGQEKRQAPLAKSEYSGEPSARRGLEPVVWGRRIVISRWG